MIKPREINNMLMREIEIQNKKAVSGETLAEQASRFEEDGKTKTKDDTGIGNLDDLLGDTPNNPIAKGPERKAGVPDMPKADAASTARATSGMTPTDTMRDMMSRMQVPDDDYDLDDEDVLPEPVEPANVPAVIRREIANSDPNAINPEWHVVANLPGNMQQAIRQLGRALFGSFTRTPTQDITMIGNIAGQGPNSGRDVKGVIGWIRDNANRVDTAGIDFDQTIPGYRANITQHTAGGVRFMVVRDQFGEYVYAWPESDSLDGQAQIPGATQARLNEGPWDPPTGGDNVVRFPGGKAPPAPAAAASSGVPKITLPKVDPAKVKSFMNLGTVKTITGGLLRKMLPAVGAYYWGSSAVDFAKSGRWRDMFISLAGAGMNIGSLFGYAAGGVGGVALTAAEVAAALYTMRIELIRMYYDWSIGPNSTDQYTDDQIYAYADELTKIMAQYLYEELKAGAEAAYKYVSSKG